MIVKSTTGVSGILLVSFLLTCANQVYGSGTIYINLDRFENPEGLAANEHCCDGKWGICQDDGCDYIFTFCMDSNRLSEDYSTSTCNYGKKVCREIPNHTTVHFLQHFGGLANPMEFHFTDFEEGRMTLTIKVDDVDDWSDNDHVDDLIQNNMAPSTEWQQLNMTSKSGQTRMIGTFRIICDTEWFGDRCQDFCPPPSYGQHYICVEGQKICEKGWHGESCDQKETATKTTQAKETTVAIETTTPTSTTTTTAEATTTMDDGNFPQTDSNVKWNEDFENNDCDRLAMNGYRYQDGVYTIQPGNSQPFDVYCDMGSSGWTVIQRRRTEVLDFNRSWQQYKEGFGDLGWNTNYWIGLENLFQLTNQRVYKLKIVMRLANLEFRFANYEKFLVTSEDDGYKIYVAGYAGNAGDALSQHNGAPFSTADKDADTSSMNCAKILKSGWWFTDCFAANLNGVYPAGYTAWPPCDAKNRCIKWSTIPNYENYSLIQVVMSILPRT